MTVRGEGRRGVVRTVAIDYSMEETRMRQERGFTLIELLIVLAILGILVGIVAMSVGGLT
ncbi:MAG: type IV pilin protein, partial [Chloroflexota bacterium]